MRKEDIYNDFMEDEISVSLREQLEKYLVHWRWFVGSSIICMLLAFVYLIYTIPCYEATSTILVKDEKKGGMLSELSIFSDLGIGSNIKTNVDNEIEILKSRTLIESTVSKLNLNVELLAKKKIRTEDIYAETPISIHVINKSKLFDDADVEFNFKFLTPDTFSLENESGDSDKSILLTKKIFQYGEKIGTPIGVLIINKTVFFSEKDKNLSDDIRIVIKPIDELTERFRKKLKVEPVSKNSSVVNISISDPVAIKAENFLDAMIRIYNEDAAEDKNFISENTSKFIASRLALITQELDGVEQNVESFKKSNKLTDIESEAKLFVENSNEYDKKGVETEIQLNVVSSLLTFIKKSSISELLPSNMLSDKSDAVGLINSYNQLVLDRNRILKSATTENPTVLKLEEQITSLKSNVTASLGRMLSNLQIQNRDLKSQEDILNSKIGRIPAQERQFKVIARQQKVKEELYLYLLQKREETAISLAATEPNARVIDAAKADENPLSPKKKIVYLAGLLFGLLVPFGIIYINDLLNIKIQNRNDLDGKTQIPYIGDVPNCNDVSELIKTNSRSSSAEALRIVRTNLSFMLSNVEEGIAKKIFVTSTFASEGKTFIASNLAASFALLGKKVLLIGMDIRNPRLNDYIALPSEGLTNYLSSDNKNLEDYIIKNYEYENFYILPAGIIPPNPPELLMNKKVDTLFEKLKREYDYIIVDTAPVNLVTDTLLVAKNADTFVYVMRARFLEKRMISIVNGFFKDKKLPNMCIVLNDTNPTQKYSYGYGEKVEKRKWFKRLIS
ncbi:polysaccharide biosynthesis tyrosine autokinase [Flavobacterium sp. GN10]|uniref:non-specific protein-tyrosine kinase n=1 Tax=Flavobacterium tagetis TaxID=2801336 RepID=A0ABS1KM17_9FLAO|nr:polysaccharide biosynthesis tyrosine autokinase [Flavobacterium tagetis]MBL0739311.1 polysaccharide biosynthesis tyrosine autokinase [Flavobacterium tagetis]